MQDIFPAAEHMVERERAYTREADQLAKTPTPEARERALRKQEIANAYGIAFERLIAQ